MWKWKELWKGSGKIGFKREVPSQVGSIEAPDLALLLDAMTMFLSAGVCGSVATELVRLEWMGCDIGSLLDFHTQSLE